MGRILCPRHGAKGVALVCPHIRAAFPEHRASLVVHEVRGRLSGNEETGLCWVCSQCQAQLPQVTGDEWLDAPESRWPELVPMCGQCLEEFLRSPWAGSEELG